MIAHQIKPLFGNQVEKVYCLISQFTPVITTTKRVKAKQNVIINVQLLILTIELMPPDETLLILTLILGN